jgi:Tol biopolymer transport system component
MSSDRRFSIYRVDLNDPFRPLNLSNGFDGSCKYPAWSPDGQHISYTCSRRVNDELIWDLLITSPNRVENNILLQELHTGPERYDERKVVRHAITPSWSPDSQWIIFSSDRDGDWDIYALSIENGDLVNLTDEWPSDEFHPSWGPG